MLIEQFDVTEHDAVVTSSAAFARGVLTRPDQPHFCYVHSPIRYAWDEQFTYLAQARLGYGFKGLLYRYMLHRARIWDVRTAHGPDVMVANSQYVRTRIRRIYGRDAQVIYPPVEVNEQDYREQKDDYYVAASFLAPYKRTDLVIRAFTAMPNRRLIVVGEGQQMSALRSLAGANVTFTGYLPRRDYVETVGRAKAMVFAGCEDFGIAQPRRRPTAHLSSLFAAVALTISSNLSERPIPRRESYLITKLWPISAWLSIGWKRRVM